jgi:xylulokinase
VTDRGDASGTGYWSAATGEYRRDLLAAALGHDAVLPRVLGPCEAAGESASALSTGAGGRPGHRRQHGGGARRGRAPR